MDITHVKVFAPATIANVGAGFDVLGIALDSPGDIVIASRSDKKGLRFALGDSRYAVPADSSNVAAYVAQRMLDELDPPFGVSLILHKLLPIGSGLGSSGASCAAAAFAVNALLEQPLDRRELIRFALEGEKLATGAAHADNVAPALLGGVCLIRSYQPLDIIKLPVKNTLFWVVAHPHIILRTEDARSVLPKSVSLAAVIRQTGNLGALITGLILGDQELIGRAIQDEIAEPVRAALIPGFRAVKLAALAAGALAFSISGSGPSVFAVVATQEIAERVAAAMKQGFADHARVGCETYISGINDEGAKFQEEAR